MRRRVNALILILVLALTASGCTSESSGSDAPVPRNLVVGATAEPQTLDPSATDAAAVPQVFLYNVYETLLKIDDQGKFQPLLATSWQISKNRLTYTFDLDAKASFAGGRKVTAQDAVWSIQRFQKGQNVAAAGQLKVVKSATAKDNHTLVVTLSKPSNSWLFNMASTAGIVFDSQSATDLANKPAGSGPYQLDRWTKGSDLVLKANAGYWGSKAHFDQVTFRYFTDPNAMNSSMLSGGLDIISNLQAPQALDQFSDPSRFTVIDGTTNGEVVLSFNHQTKALKDRRVRRAINYAINRRALLDTVWNGKGTLIGSMVPPTDPWYQDLSGTYPYDPAKAKKLLAEAGYGNGLKLRLRLPTLPYATASGQFVASQLKDVGITATIDELEFPARWLDVVFTKGNYDMSIIAHVEPRDIVKYGDPHYYWHYDNPKVTKLIAEADAGTEAEQVAKMKQVAKILAEDAAADWLFLLPNLVITKADITGVPKNATTLSFDLTGIRRK